MKQGDINIRKQNIRGLLSDVDAGRFAIPHLQREFVWNGPKTAKLLDSILRGMPIGVIMVWETPASQRLHLREKYNVLPPFNSTNRKVWFLIDGQQRVSVLHHARQGDRLENSRGQNVNFSNIVLSLNKKKNEQEIHYRRPSSGEYVSMSEVLHPHWKQKLKGLGKQKLARVAASRGRILGYDLFIMTVHGEVADVRESFLRINTQGMKVTTADAIFTQAESLDLRDITHEVRGHIDDTFKGVPDQPILFLLSAVRGGMDPRGRAVDGTIRKLSNEAKNNPALRKSLAKEWGRIGTCVGKAVDYLRKNFCVARRDFLASDYMLVILAYFFFFNGRGPSREQAEEIRKWFWATSVGSRYSGRDFNRCVPEDLKFFNALAESPVRRKFMYDPQAEASEVQGAQYASPTAITSAVYCMLLRRSPVSLLDSGLNEIPIHSYSTVANRKDRHHIFPRKILHNAQVPPKRYNSISNICITLAEENQKIGSQKPEQYLGDLNKRNTSFRAKMGRHLIPINDESGIWDENIKRGFDRFLKERTRLICKALEEEAGIPLFRK